MRRFLRWLFGVVGVVLLLVGGAVAAYVGPGDRVRLPAHEVSDGAPVTVVGWRLLGYRDTTVGVTVTASDGAVFLGAANPVDLASYLGDRPFVEVRQVSPTGALSGPKVGTGAGGAPADPGPAGFWTASVSGVGEQRLEVPLTGDPVSVAVVAPVGSTVSIGLGAVVPGAFRAALVAAVVGLLLVLVSVVMSRRAHRDRGTRGARVDRVAGAAAVAGAGREPGDAKGAREVRSRVGAGSDNLWGHGVEPPSQADPGHATRSARTGAAAGTLVLGLSLSGCVALPPSVAEPTGGVTKLAMSPEQMPEVLKDYDARNDAVNAGIAKGADPATWATVDTGTVLFADQVNTALERASGKTPDTATSTWKRTGTAVYSGGFVSYPLWAEVQSTWSKEGAEPTKSLAIFERASVTEPWKMASSVTQQGDIPPPLLAAVQPPSAVDTAAGIDLMTKTAAYLTKGTDPGFAAQDVLTQARTANLTYETFKANLDCRPMVVAERPEDSVRVVRTSAGLLVTVRLRCEQTIYSPEGQTIFWKPEFAKAYETTTNEGPTVTRVLSATLTLHQGADNAVQVVSQRFDGMRAKDAGWAQ